ncbi:Unconventional myosin-XV [Gonapodya sp. JEL0774]|nr:Unconventional myosin-XV [Gonapodya sp. JEL0774]
MAYFQVKRDLLMGLLCSTTELQADQMDGVMEVLALMIRIQVPASEISKASNKLDQLLRPFIPDIIYKSWTQSTPPHEIISRLERALTSIQSLSESESKHRFISLVKLWELFGTTIFVVRASNDPRFSNGGMLCVDAEGVKVLKTETREVVANYGYDEIINFRYDENEFVMRTGDMMQKRVIRFQTNQGFVIADLIHSYVQYHLRQNGVAGGAVTRGESSQEINRAV